LLDAQGIGEKRFNNLFERSRSSVVGALYVAGLPSPDSRAFQRIGIIQRACLIAIPVLLLAYDFWCFPVTFAVRGLSKNISVVSLVTNKLISLGTYNSHTIHVSLDSIERRDFLGYVKGSPNAIVISYFVEPESPEVWKGELARAFEAKLKNVSSEADREYQDQLNHLAGRPPGDVSRFDVHISQKKYHEMPIDRVYAVLAKTKGQSNREVLSKAIPQVLERAGRDNISSLIVPCIAYNWANKNSATFDEFFEPLLSSLSMNGAPTDIYLPLYTAWPSFTLEEAVKSLNHCWEKVVTPSINGVIVSFYRADYRWTLLFLTVCLFVSSFYAPLTFKNFLIIGVSFIAVATGAIQTVDFVTQGHGALFCSVVKIATLFFLALGFPFLVNWNPKNVFYEQTNHHG
jgi:hypothetical protein